MELAQLMRIMPNTQRGAVFLNPLIGTMAEFGIATLHDRAAFLANVGHETGQLSAFEENLNYSNDRLCAVWPVRFPTISSTAGYSRNPPALANKVYANRMGNGDEKSGEGWKFRGSGLLMLTGKTSHLACALHFDIDPDAVGDWLRTPTGASRSAGWYWREHRLSDIADFDSLCDLINIGHKTPKVGDSIGYPDRLAMYQRGLEALA